MKDKTSTIINTLTAILAVLIGYKIKESGIGDKIPNFIIYSIALLIILLIMPIRKLGNFLIYWVKRIRTDFIYRRYETTLEYLDEQGKSVSLYAKAFVDRISLRFVNRTEATIFTEVGKLKSIHIHGINSNLIVKKDQELTFEAYFSKENVANRKNVFSYSAEFENVFNKKKQRYWEVAPRYFCQSYDVKIILPDGIKNLTCHVERKDSSVSNFSRDQDKQNGKWKIEHNVPYTVYYKYGKKILNVVIHKITDRSQYRIFWDFSY